MHILIRAHGAVAYREALFAEETPYAAMEATLPKGSKAKARLDGKRGACRRRGRTLRPLSSARSYAPPMADTLA